jgi:uncharacterized phiE125 gp8 family phage protein
MTVRLVTPPAALALSLASAKAALRIDGSDQDELVSSWVAGIVSYAEHITGRSFVNQGWRVTLDAFPDAIELPRPPVIQVASVQFLDSNDALQTLSPADYVSDIASEPGYVVPARGKSWPATYDEINAVTVECTCGYGANESAVPAGIKLYILAKLREQFDPAIHADRGAVQSSFLDSLLDPFKVYA